MAHFEIVGDRLCLRMGTGEHVAALSGDVEVPLAAVTDVEVVEPAWRHVDGMRVGTGLPGVLVAGRFYASVETIAVCHGGGPGVSVGLKGSSPGRIVATVEDPSAVASQIRTAAKLTQP